MTLRAHRAAKNKERVHRGEELVGARARDLRDDELTVAEGLGFGQQLRGHSADVDARAARQGVRTGATSEGVSLGAANDRVAAATVTADPLPTVQIDSGIVWAYAGVDISAEVIKRFDAAPKTAPKKTAKPAGK